MVTALLLAFGVVFLAELGDRSQLMALTFALKYHWWTVLCGLSAAVATAHAVSVLVGHFLGAAIPATAITLVGGLAFIAFGVWTLREAFAKAHGPATALALPQRTGLQVFGAVFSAFLLAELGDKTMLATITLATNHNWFAVWAGSTLGMITADALALALGLAIGKHLPERLIYRVSGMLFFGFGTSMLIEVLMPHAPALTIVAISAAGAVALTGSVLAVARYTTSHRQHDPFIHARQASVRVG